MKRTLLFLAGLLPGVVVERRQCGTNDRHTTRRLTVTQWCQWQKTREVTCRVRDCSGLMRTPEQLAALRRSASTEVRPRRWPDDFDGLVI